MMFGMGFFVRKHQSYQMTLPSCLTVEKVRAAVIKYAETEDVECVLHPEDLVTTMPFAKATALQDRLRAVDAVLSLRSIAKDLAGSAEGAGIGGAAQGGCTLYR